MNAQQVAIKKWLLLLPIKAFVSKVTNIENLFIKSNATGNVSKTCDFYSRKTLSCMLFIRLISMRKS